MQLCKAFIELIRLEDVKKLLKYNDQMGNILTFHWLVRGTMPILVR